MDPIAPVKRLVFVLMRWFCPAFLLPGSELLSFTAATATGVVVLEQVAVVVIVAVVLIFLSWFSVDAAVAAAAAAAAD